MEEMIFQAMDQEWEEVKESNLAKKFTGLQLAAGILRVCNCFSILKML